MKRICPARTMFSYVASWRGIVASLSPAVKTLGGVRHFLMTRGRKFRIERENYVIAWKMRRDRYIWSTFPQASSSFSISFSKVGFDRSHA